MPKRFTIGEVSERTGVAASALRFYEDRGLISSERTDGNQRRYRPAVLRTVSVIRAAQEVGITLSEVGEALADLPHDHAPTSDEWTAMAAAWQAKLDDRIRLLTALRHELDGCIGCGCLSLETCGIFNPDDAAQRGGSGPRYLFGDERVAGV